MSDSAKETFRAMMEQVWNQKSAGAIEEYISDDYVGRNPDGDITGLDGFRQLYATYTSAFPDCNVTIEQLLSDGDWVTFHYVWHGTHDGELMGVAPSGKSVAVHGIGVAQVRDGKVVEDRVVWDTLSLMQQIGAA